MQARDVSTNRLKTGVECHNRRVGGILRVTLGGLLACALLAGCTVAHKAPQEILPLPIPEQQAETPPVVIPPPAPPARPARLVLPPVAILLSDDGPAYTRIADELVTRLPRKPKIISLQGNPAASAQAIRKLNESGRGYIVAIGPLAAQTASRLSNRQIVFCQVFNYQDYDLSAANVRGVSTLPPAGAQFREWKKLDAGLQRVGVITGPGHEALIKRARRSAGRHGIELVHRVVQSDKEMLYTFKRMTPEIQGLWLLPDDRILSRRVLRDTMAYSIKHRKQVVVFHPELLRLGGLMSASGTEADVAVQVIAALRAAVSRTAAPASRLFPLTKIRIEVNAARAQQLNISSSPKPRIAADVP